MRRQIRGERGNGGAWGHGGQGGARRWARDARRLPAACASLSKRARPSCPASAGGWARPRRGSTPERRARNKTPSAATKVAEEKKEGADTPRPRRPDRLVPSLPHSPKPVPRPRLGCKSRSAIRGRRGSGWAVESGGARAEGKKARVGRKREGPSERASERALAPSPFTLPSAPPPSRTFFLPGAAPPPQPAAGRAAPRLATPSLRLQTHARERGTQRALTSREPRAERAARPINMVRGGGARGFHEVGAPRTRPPMRA